MDLIDEAGLRDRRPDLVELIEAALPAKPQQKEDTKMSTEELVAVQKKLDEATKSHKELEESSKTEGEALTKERDELKDQAAEGQRVVARAKVQEAVAKAELPEPSQKRLVQQFESVEVAEITPEKITEAVKAETQYLKELAEAGKVENLGETKKQEEDGHTAFREALIVDYQLKGQSLEEAQASAEKDLARRQ